MSKILSLALVALAALLLVACGGESKDDYAEEVDDVLQPLAVDLQELGQQATAATTNEEVAATLGEVETKLDDALGELEGIDPPEDVADLNDELIAEIDGYLGLVTDTREVIEGGDAQAISEATTTFITESQQFATDLADIRDRAQDAGVPLEDPTTSDSE